MKVLLLTTFAFLLLNNAGAEVRPEYSGAWYSPDQSGHGLSIEVLDETRSVAFWYTYTQDGHPTFLLADGVNTGNEILAKVYHHEGMIWGEFDPASLQQQEWGTLGIVFHDCMSASLNWDFTMSGYGSGSLPLSRLSFIQGMGCNETGGPDQQATPLMAELAGDWSAYWDAIHEGPGLTATLQDDGLLRFSAYHEGYLVCSWEGSLEIAEGTALIKGTFGTKQCLYTMSSDEVTGIYVPLAEHGGERITLKGYAEGIDNGLEKFTLHLIR